MRRFLLLLVMVLTTTVSFAQGKQTFKQLPQKQSKWTLNSNAKAVERSRSKAPIMKADNELVTPPESATVEEWTVDGAFYMWGGQEAGMLDYTDYFESMNVVIDGNDLYIQGMAYYFGEAWIKGTIDGSTVTFPASNYIGTDEYGDEFLVGSADGSTLSPIEFSYDEANKKLELQTYVFENAEADEISYYGYWYELTLSSDGSASSTVTPPAGLETSEWIFSADEVNFIDEENYELSPVYLPLNIGFGEDGFIYIQGLNSYLPESWLKATFDNDVLTIPGGQYYGKVQGYKMYFFGIDDSGELCDATFAFDSETATMTAQTDIVLNGSQTEYDSFGDYTNALIIKCQDVAGTPATPDIYYEESLYGPCLYATIPLFDTNNVPMSPSKISYRIYKEIDHATELFTLKADENYYSRLTSDMTDIPYLFTEDWDVYIGCYPLYVYADDFDDWNKVGIQVIYTGGGETNESEIGWYEIKPYPQGTEVTYTFDFNALPTETTPYSTNSSTKGDITEEKTITEGKVSLTISPSGGDTANRYWYVFNTKVIQLRVYGGTLTFATENEDNITSIEFYNGKWNEYNAADSGSFKTASDGTTMVWKGAAPTVEISIGGNTQLNKIVVFVDDTTYSTGIDTMTTYSVSDGAIYNLQGQRVSQPTKGIYIRDGKKFLVK